MNATLLGKILVFVNLTIALIFAGWAVGVLTNRIDWTGTGAPAISGERAQGEFAKRKSEIQDREKAAGFALGRWMTNTADLLDLETNQRPTAQAWYRNKLSILEKGVDEARKPADLSALVYDKDGRLVLYQEGHKLVGPTKQALPSRVALNQLLTSTENDIQAQIRAEQTALKQAEELTVEINGIKGGQKGLRDLIKEQETAYQNALSELEYAKPFRYNRQMETELLTERRAEMEARLQELKKLAMAQGKS
jgi:hypothetical protein